MQFQLIEPTQQKPSQPKISLTICSWFLIYFCAFPPNVIRFQSDKNNQSAADVSNKPMYYVYLQFVRFVSVTYIDILFWQQFAIQYLHRFMLTKLRAFTGLMKLTPRLTSDLLPTQLPDNNSAPGVQNRYHQQARSINLFARWGIESVIGSRAELGWGTRAAFMVDRNNFYEV